MHRSDDNSENWSRRQHTQDLLNRPFWTFVLPKSRELHDLQRSYPVGLFFVVVMLFAFAATGHGATEGDLFVIKAIAVTVFVAGILLPKWLAVLIAKISETRAGRLVLRTLLVTALISMVGTLIYFRILASR